MGSVLDLALQPRVRITLGCCDLPRRTAVASLQTSSSNVHADTSIHMCMHELVILLPPAGGPDKVRWPGSEAFGVRATSFSTAEYITCILATMT